MTENWNGPELSLLTKLTLMGVNNPIRAKECDTTHNSSELLGKAKNKRLIRIPNIRAELIVCTSLDENAITHSILIGSKNVRKGGGINF